MKRALFALAAVAAIYAPLAHADGTITFSGTLSATTCTVTTSGGTDSFAVDLGNPAVATMASSGLTGAPATFSFTLSGCTGSAAQAVAYFYDPTPGTNINAAGRLKNVSSPPAPTVPATGVDVALMDAAAPSTPLNLNGGHFAQGANLINFSGGGATLNYLAQYFATSAPSAGPVQAVVSYAIDYR